MDERLDQVRQELQAPSGPALWKLAEQSSRPTRGVSFVTRRRSKVIISGISLLAGCAAAVLLFRPADTETEQAEAGRHGKTVVKDLAAAQSGAMKIEAEAVAPESDEESKTNKTAAAAVDQLSANEGSHHQPVSTDVSDNKRKSSLPIQNSNQDGRLAVEHSALPGNVDQLLSGKNQTGLGGVVLREIRNLKPVLLTPEEAAALGVFTDGGYLGYYALRRVDTRNDETRTALNKAGIPIDDSLQFVLKREFHSITRKRETDYPGITAARRILGKYSLPRLITIESCNNISCRQFNRITDPRLDSAQLHELAFEVNAVYNIDHFRFGNTDLKALMTTVLDETGIMHFEHSKRIDTSKTRAIVDLTDYPILANLIPLYFQTSQVNYDSKGREFTEKKDIILWYDPTEEFIARLPERIQSYLNTRKRDFPSAPAQTLAQGDLFFDTWNVDNGAISELSVMPNPATDGRVELHFTLAEQRDISISLLDMFGRPAASPMEPTSLPPGNHSKTIQINGLPFGFYLLAIQSGNGEQAIQRLIVQ